MREPRSDGDHRPGRPFPWICPKCRKKEVRLATIPHETERLHDGRLVAVAIPDLAVPKCESCGELVFNYAADERILAAAGAQVAALCAK